MPELRMASAMRCLGFARQDVDPPGLHVGAGRGARGELEDVADRRLVDHVGQEGAHRTCATGSPRRRSPSRRSRWSCFRVRAFPCPSGCRRSERSCGRLFGWLTGRACLAQASDTPQAILVPANALCMNTLKSFAASESCRRQLGENMLDNFMDSCQMKIHPEFSRERRCRPSQPPAHRRSANSTCWRRISARCARRAG